jgi:hypothetical protein
MQHRSYKLLRLGVDSTNTNGDHCCHKYEVSIDQVAQIVFGTLLVPNSDDEDGDDDEVVGIKRI